MLNSLSVQNYALISSVEVNFHSGLSAITGETGAGKSILMGALSLIIGSRADTGILNDKSRKCIVEARFQVDGLGLESLFDEYDLDFESLSLIRREILPGGKSRAFINDTPVTLPVLKSIGSRLVNIHAQHHNLLLRDEGFPLEVVDAFLGLQNEKGKYARDFHQYKEILTRIIALEKKLQADQKEQDYLEFQYKQLEEARLQAGEEDGLEKEQEILTHAEEIRSAMGAVVSSFSEVDLNVLQMIKKALQDLSSIEKYLPHLEEPAKRLDSVYIELKDLSFDLEQMLEKVEVDPERLNNLSERLDLLYTLQKKHQAGSSEDLIKIQEDISSRLEEISTSDTELSKLKTEQDFLVSRLRKMALNLRKKRISGLKALSEAVVMHLKDVGMPHAKFEIRHIPLENFDENGIDQFSFLFSANKNQQVELIQKVASGGEMSRLMLCIKSLVSESSDVPTLIFDEIDAGVSGEIADKMGKMLKKIAGNRQVINVTHLPQVAGRGDHHYQVFKYDDKDTTRTGIRLLNTDNRIMEMAKMLSGEQLTNEALSNAKALLHR